MLNLETLNLLLTDPELRAQVSRLISGKIKSDVQMMKASAELSRHLIEAERRQGRDGKPVIDRANLRELVKEHLDFYETLVNLSFAFSERLVERLRDMRGEATSAKSAATMHLSVPLQSTARAPFRLENNRTTPVSITFELTPFVSEDGSELVASTGVFDPPAAQVQPGQEMRIELILPVAAPFKPGHAYFATIAVKGLEAMQIIVRLNVEAARPVASEAPVVAVEQPAADTAAERPRAEGGNVDMPPTASAPRRPARKVATPASSKSPRGAGRTTSTRARVRGKQRP